MANFEGDSDTKKFPARAAARFVLAAGAGIAAAVSLVAAPAAAASGGTGTSQLGLAAHKPSSTIGLGTIIRLLFYPPSS